MLREKLQALNERYHSGNLDKYEYIREKHEFNKILLDYPAMIRGSSISSIKISPDSIVFSFDKPVKMELETDEGARSATFEVLNFGAYEPEDENIVFKLLQPSSTILDIGAHIGWYAVTLGKMFPKSQIYAFEPIPATWQVLQRNLERNGLRNVLAMNVGCAQKEQEKELYYFKGGSALASIENLINHDRAIKIQCLLKPLDILVKELLIEKVDFIKCDAEGSELFVLQGAQEIINQYKPILFMEIYHEWCQKCGYSPSDIALLLQSWGYKSFQGINGKLQEVHQITGYDKDRYNYFFIGREDQLNFIKHI